MEIKYDLENMVHVKDGYEYITSRKLYIPIEEIGLKILVRKQQELLFFYEIIIKLIKSNISDIKQISEITGIEEEILYDVIADMSVERLIHVIGTTLKLTVKGNEALQQLIQETIEKENLRKIYIDCITGEIFGEIKLVENVKKNNPWLECKVNIDEEFISKNFNRFNNIYKERQEEYNVENSELVRLKEIYQILEKEYGRTLYLEKKINIFKNLSDNSITFETGDEQDESYIISFREQIENSKFGAREFLIDEKIFKKNVKMNFVEDENKKRNSTLLNNAILEMNDENIDKYYNKERYLFNDELSQILLNIKNIKPSKIVISSKVLLEILSNDVIEVLCMILDRAEVVILADKQEWKIQELEKKMLNKKTNKKHKIIWKYTNNSNEDKIILYPYATINRYFIPIPYDGKSFILKEIGEISFEKSKIDSELEATLGENDITTM
ncbi:hypothetical protein CDLVIII_5466 [Clostridium sp. DL-VIII]|uniref:hypothetical protein n=1 Tax=Clostridium sp. DL-VIII TaxID=641107 RepID=UPI00023B0500|nr:hypothetical protein [Clostridium sp. DL-VIII]EHJ01940.1 hypothetical protein CDLVIII_5466 [Clostridium sp. DL-VIII]